MRFSAAEYRIWSKGWRVMTLHCAWRCPQWSTIARRPEKSALPPPKSAIRRRSPAFRPVCLKQATRATRPTTAITAAALPNPQSSSKPSRRAIAAILAAWPRRWPTRACNNPISATSRAPTTCSPKPTARLRAATGSPSACCATIAQSTRSTSVARCARSTFWPSRWRRSARTTPRTRCARGSSKARWPTRSIAKTSRCSAWAESIQD